MFGMLVQLDLHPLRLALHRIQRHLLILSSGLHHLQRYRLF